MFYEEYINGYIQRTSTGRYVGSLRIDGVDISPVEATFFEDDGKKYVWIKRPPVKEYDFDTSTFIIRKPRPQWEVYMEKTLGDGVVEYVGTFTFLRFRYKIKGVWDSVLGKEKSRLNLFVERLPMNEQSILISINDRKKQEHEERRRD
jgi:hypothetical protein